MTQGGNKQVVLQVASTRYRCLVPDFKPSGLQVLRKLSKTALYNADLTNRLDEMFSVKIKSKICRFCQGCNI